MDASSYCYSLLKDPLVTHYTNFKRKQCLNVSMECGVSQGNQVSGAFFKVCRANITILESIITIFISFIRLPDDTFLAIDNFDISCTTLLYS